MAGKRTYADYCAAAHALDIVGERWALLIVRELLLGPRRFGDLRAGLPAISPNVLTQRLAELESSGVLRRRRLDPPAGVWVYELTNWGRELEPIVLRLAYWGARSPAFERGMPVTPDALLLSFKVMFRPAPSDIAPVRISLIVEGQPYHAAIEHGVLTASRGHAEAPADATAHADTPLFLSLAYGGLDPEDAASQGALRYTGDTDALRRFFSAFRLPDVAAPGLVS